MATGGSAGGGHNSQSRERRRSRSQSHDYFDDGRAERRVSRDDDRHDYYRDRDRHPPSRHNDSYGKRSHMEDRRPRYVDDPHDNRSNNYHDEMSSSFKNDSYYGSSSRDKNQRRSRSNGSRRDADYAQRRINSEPREHRSDPMKHPDSPPAGQEWPPCFDTDGSSFVFDNRSAMFYESLSDFFYDPKSKLYYGNRKGAYFRYDETTDPPFVEVQKVEIPANESKDGRYSTMEQVPLHSTAKEQGSISSKPKIAIKLKTTKISSVKEIKAPIVLPPVIPKSQKEQIANIEKWTEKQAELKQNENECAPAAVTSAAATTHTGKVRMTSKGEPICIICKRKFPNIDKLRLHESASDLHKQNLLKLKETEVLAAKRKSSEATSSSAEYQDRAQKRRQLHGLDFPDTFRDRRGADLDLSQESTAPGVALDETHVGHQMLQKMGWKGHDEEESQNGRGRASSSAANQLRKDWDRIEALASNPQRPPGR